MAIAELRNVTRSYGSGPARVDALRDVSLRIEPGEFTVFKGPSGSGKTTLLNQIGLLDTPTEGELSIDGQRTRELSSRALSRLRADKIGFIFQSFNLVPVLSAQENVELALELAGRKDGTAAAARSILAQVGLAGLEHRRPNELSGGQQQRVAIARALVKEPRIIIADEPTANLDSENGEQVLVIMQRLNAELGITFLFSSHDPRVIAHARRVVTLVDGRVFSDEPGAGASRTPAAAPASATPAEAAP
jgi:putative ABC transport system ATP-binding protein